MKLRFGQKVSLGIATLIVALLSTVLAVSDSWITQAVEKNIDEGLSHADRSVVEVFKVRAAELAAHTRVLVDVPHLLAPIDAPSVDHATALDSARSARRLVGSDLLLLVDARGRLLASATQPERSGDRLLGNEAVAAALGGQTFEGLISTDDGIYQVVSAPIGSGGEVAGALVTGFAVGDALLTTLENMTGSHVALWSPSVAMVSNRARPVFGEVATKLVATPGATATIETKGGPYLVRVGQIAGTEVSYALARSLDAELAFYREARIGVLGAGAGVLAVALPLGLLFSRRVTEPIRALAAAAAKLSHGDFSHAVDVRTGDEVGELAASFNTMAADIDRLIGEERTLAAEERALKRKLETLNAELRTEIDERQRAEREISSLNEDLEERVAARTAELETANRQLESFSYSVSHDLRGPLRRIAAFSDLVLEDAAPRLAEADRDNLERIRASALGMGRMIEKLLEFAHVGRGELVREPVDLGAMARSILEELARADSERRVDFVVAEGLVARGDEALLAAAMQNLLSNAWKFTSHCPRTRIEVGAEIAESGERVFFVRDNGAGFEAADTHRLFRVFERLHSSREFEGHGIGLATVRRIVEFHGGRIWASGAPGAGSTFRFVLGEA